MTPRQHAERVAKVIEDFMPTNPSRPYTAGDRERLVAALGAEFENAQRPPRGMFPIMGCQAVQAIPWALIAPCEAQAQRNHDQDLETLARRGGLDAGEAVAVLTGQRLRQVNMDRNEAALALRSHVANFEKARRDEETDSRLAIMSDEIERLKKPDFVRTMQALAKLGLPYFDSPTLGRGKLVRDRVPDEIEARAGTEKVSTIPVAEMLDALLTKLWEETQECIGARGDEDKLAEELGDVLEVVWTIADTEALDIVRARTDKAARRGRFTRRAFLRAEDLEAWRARGGT